VKPLLAAVFLLLGVTFKMIELFGQGKTVRGHVDFRNNVNAEGCGIGNDLS
jgi:hypothetical protein